MRAQLKSHSFSHNFIILSKNSSSVTSDLPTMENPVYLKLKCLETCKEIFVSWIGHTTDSESGTSNPEVHLNCTFMELNDLAPDSILSIQQVTKPVSAQGITLSTKSQEDYAIISVNSGMLEGSILGQITCLQKGIKFNIQVNETSGFQLEFRNDGGDNQKLEEVVSIGINSELTILPPKIDAFFQDEKKTGDEEFWVRCKAKEWSGLNLFEDELNCKLVGHSGEQYFEENLFKNGDILKMKNCTFLGLDDQFMCDDIIIELQECQEKGSIDTKEKCYADKIVIFDQIPEKIQIGKQALRDLKISVKSYQPENSALKQLILNEFKETKGKIILKNGTKFSEKFLLNFKIEITNEAGFIILDTEETDLEQLEASLQIIFLGIDENEIEIKEENWKKLYLLPNTYNFNLGILEKLNESNLVKEDKNSHIRVNIRSVEKGESKMISEKLLKIPKFQNFSSLKIDIEDLTTSSLSHSPQTDNITSKVDDILTRLTHFTFGQGSVFLEIIGLSSIVKEDAQLNPQEYWSVQFISSKLQQYIKWSF